MRFICIGVLVTAMSLPALAEDDSWRLYYKLDEAARSGDHETTEALLNRGLEINYNGSPFNHYPLVFKPFINCDSVSQDHAVVLKMLLENGADAKSVGLKSNDSTLTQLAYCDERDSVILMASLLLSYGANPKHIGSSEMSALYRAILRNNERLALVLAKYSEVGEREYDAAMGKGMGRLLREFIDQDIAFDNHPLLYWAIRFSKDDLLRTLLLRGVDPNKFINSPLENYDHPIIFAASISNTMAVKVLHGFGASLEALSQNDESIMDIAVRRGNKELITWLVDAGS